MSIGGISTSTRSPGRSGAAPADFRAIFETYRSFVFRTLRRRGVLRTDLHDVCQDVFFAVHRKFAAYDRSISLRLWIAGICERVAAAYRRAARRGPKSASEPAALESLRAATASQDRLVDSRRACAHAEELLAMLDDEKRRVFVLYEIEGLHMNEVVDFIGCPLQTGYSRLRAARKAIRGHLRRRPLLVAGRQQRTMNGQSMPNR